jgi:head-tail adaptor
MIFLRVLVVFERKERETKLSKAYSGERAGRLVKEWARAQVVTAAARGRSDRKREKCGQRDLIDNERLETFVYFDIFAGLRFVSFVYV